MRTTRTTTDPSSGPPEDESGSASAGRPRGQRGVALILVLWTFAAVAVLAAEFARAMHDEAASTRNFKESEQARMVAIAGVNEVVLALRAARHDRGNDEIVDEESEPADPVRSLSHGDGQWVESSFQGHRYEVRVIDESGKLSLNKIDQPLMIQIFENLEIEDDVAEIIADSIVDWRDDDDFHQTNGAENEYYEGLDRPYRCKNAFFESIDELMLVRGVTRDIYYGHDGIPGLKDIFSVYSLVKTINLDSVAPEVMIAITGMDPEDANEFGSARRRAERQAAFDQLKTELGANGISAKSNKNFKQMTIEARVHDVSGQTVLAHVGGVFNLDSNGEGLKLYRWCDSIFDDSDSKGAQASGETS